MIATTEYSIRDATVADVPAMAGLAAEFAEYMRGLDDTTTLHLDAGALERDGFGPRPAFEGLVAETAGGVVGYLLHHDGYDTDAACRVLFVVDLFVTRTLRQHGVGVALMRAASGIARGRGAKQLVWTVDRSNLAAQRFYQGIGGTFVQDLRLMYLDVEPRGSR